MLSATGVGLPLSIQFSARRPKDATASSGALKRLPRVLTLVGALMGVGGMTASCTTYNQIAKGMVPEDTFQRAIQPYKDPIEPADYNDANPQHVKFIPSQMHKEKALAALRAQFNRSCGPDKKTCNLNLLNPYLHYRSRLSEQAAGDKTGAVAKKLAAHDKMILDFANSPQVKFYMATIQGRLTEMDTSTRYLIAASLIDLMHNRPDVVAANIKQDAPLRIIMHEHLKQTAPNRKGEIYKQEVGGYWSFGNADVHLNKAAFWLGILDRHDGYMPIQHEYSHGLNSKSYLWFNIPITGFNGMSDEDKSVVSSEQKRLSQMLKPQVEEYVEKGQKKPPKTKDEDTLGPAPDLYIRDDDSSEVGDILYGLTEKWELMPSTVETFYETPQSLQKRSQPLYDILKRFFRFDPANNYQDIDVKK